MPNDAHQLDTAQFSAAPQAEPQRTGMMGWIRSHPFLAALCMALFLILIGAFVVLRRGAAAPAQQGAAWGGANITVLNPTSYGQQQVQAQQPNSIMQQVQNAPPYTYTPLPTGTGNTYSESGGSDQGANGSFDFNAFVQLLSHGSPKTGGGTADSGLSGAYSFIPSGIISTSTPTAQRTPKQQELYDYGNEVGSYVQSFDEQHPTEAQVLKDQAEDRHNPDKIAQVVRIARDLRALGQSMAGIDTVPDAASEAQSALAESYIEIGTNLEAVAKAANDKEFLSSIQTYNASADVFTKNYIAMVQLFGSFGVKFDPNDPGSVFEFTPLSL